MNDRSFRHRLLSPLLTTVAAAAMAMPFALPAAPAQAEPPPADRSTAAWALAEEFHALARKELGVANTSENATESLERAAALLRQASDLAPDEGRHHWLLSEVALRLGDRDLALEALTRYRGLDRDDEVAAIRFIDLTVAAKQTVEDKLSYLDRIEGVDSLSPAVRSHIALLAHDLLRQVGDDPKADAKLDDALRHNDLNPAALQRAYERAAKTGDAGDRVAALVELLRANVAQPAVMIRLAEELAEAGLVDESVQWYRRGLETAFAMQLRAVPNDYVRYGSLLIRNDLAQDAQATLGLLLDADPTNGEALFLQLVAERQQNRTIDTNNQHFNAARRALIGRLNGLSTLAAGGELPENPDTANLPDLVADANRLANGENPALANAYVETLADYAWLEIFFLERAPSQDTLDAIELLAGEDQPVTARLQGWAALRDGQTDRARVKFQAIADRDPLARLGLLMLDGEPDRDKAEQLLADVRSGVLAAMIYDAVRDSGARVRPSEDADRVIAALRSLPPQALDLLDPQQVRQFYSIRLDPVKVSHAFAEPMLVRASIVNNSDIPLTLGPGGLLQDVLQLNVSVAGAGQVPGVAYDALGGDVRLDPRESLGRLYRVDTGQLEAVLENNPMAPFTLFVSGFTNPVEFGPNQLGPGPAGYRQQMRQPLDRRGAPLANAAKQNALFDELVRGTGAEKIYAASLIAKVASGNVEGVADPEGAMRAQASFRQKLERARDFEQDPAVRGWAGLLLAVQQKDPEDRARQARALLLSDEPAMRMAGLLAASTMPKDLRDPLVETVAGGDTPVADYAESLLRTPDAEPVEDAAAAGQ